MINRGTHVIYSDLEILQRIRKKSTLKVLSRLMWFYETREQRKAIARSEGLLSWNQDRDFEDLMREVGRWMQPSLILEFKNANNPRPNADGHSHRGVNEVNLSKAERRRRRREERKNSLNGVRGGSE